MLLHDMKPGDALLHSRYCFHRGVPFAHGDVKLRYSIRYTCPRVAASSTTSSRR